MSQEQTLQDIYQQLCNLFDLVNNIKSKLDNPATANNAVVLFPGERFEHLPFSNQLVLTFGLINPANKKEKNSTWHMSIPEPIEADKLNWCTHFEPLKRTKGTVCGTIQWREVNASTGKITNHGNRTHAWFNSEQNAIEFMSLLIPLSKLKPVEEAGKPLIRITKGGSPKRKPSPKAIQCISATRVTVDPNTGDITECHVFKRPTDGC